LIPKECKRLAEVDFPIAAVSKQSAREKSIRHGHPSTLHLWWARRPLAACRAILLGLLLPDPCDPHCPEDFKFDARELLPKTQGNIGPKDQDLRQALLKFIGDFSNWDLSADRTYLEVSRALVKAAHPEDNPLVADPFAGGGSIPLEAIRLDCEAFASDLNPVACLILKVMLEDIPRHGPELADELRRVGKEVKEAAEKELAKFYPPDLDGSKPIAYIWARTVRCEAPNCGAEIPLMRSLWLCKKTVRRRALRYRIVRPLHSPPQVNFEIFEPSNDRDVPRGTISHAKATCLCCNSVLSPERVQAQINEQRGGADVVFDKLGKRISGARLLAVVSLKPGEAGRHYRSPTAQDYQAVWMAMIRQDEVALTPLSNGLTSVPDEPLPPIGTLGFRVQRYGMLKWGDLFTARQKLILSTFANILREIEVSETIRELLAINLNHAIDRSTSLCLWRAEPYMETVEHVYGRQALPMIWDFAEAMLLSSSTGSFEHALEVVSQCIETNSTIFRRRGQKQCADATAQPLVDQSASIWFTDPPYYDAVPYADLSDFFFVWLKRVLASHPLIRDPFDSQNPLTPKIREIVQDETKKFNGGPKDRSFFEKTMSKTFEEGRRVLREDGVGCVVFAHKTTEGWEALLSGMIQGGWTITGSWPIATEMGTRLRARESAALATSVHLVCRPRTEGAPVGDWGNVLQELPRRVGDWMERLQSEGIRGADLVFACIGPALEIFSRYSKVETAEGREVGLPEFLEKVWEVVGRTALEQVLGTADLPAPRLRQAGAKAGDSTAGLPPGALAQGGALEEDARLTALFLWTLQSTNGNSSKEEKEDDEDEEEDEDEEDTGKDAGATRKKQGYSLIFDVVRRFAQPLGIHLPEWEGRVIETEKGVVRLLSVKERVKQLFGEESVSVAGFRIEEQARRDPQMKFDFVLSQERAAPDQPAEALAQAGIKARRPRKKKEQVAESSPKAGVTTTLDRVHAAMLLQASGQTNALRALLKAEVDRGPDFLRLANALSALYPKQSEEKRLLDAMLLVIPR